MNPLVASGADDTRRARTALSVNVNKVALLRNTRHLGIPSVVRAATLALQAGAQGITVHPRPDERHIRAADVHELAALLRQWPQAEYNIEGNPFQNLMDFVRAVRPQQCTLVPDSEGQFTSDHGWDLAADGERLRPLIDEAHALGVRVSLFMDADPAAMAMARAVGADRVELYTEPYAAAHGTPQQADAAGALRRGGAGCAGGGPGRQRRPRPEPRQPDRLPARRARRVRGLDRPRLDRRCAGVRHGRDGAAVSAAHPGGDGLSRCLASVPRRAERRAVPKPARIPSGDRRRDSFDEGRT